MLGGRLTKRGRDNWSVSTMFSTPGPDDALAATMYSSKCACMNQSPTRRPEASNQQAWHTLTRGVQACMHACLPACVHACMRAPHLVVGWPVNGLCKQQRLARCAPCMHRKPHSS